MGEKLFSDVTEATGLPNDAISRELERLLAGAGVEKSDMTLEDLRHILAEYVQDTLLEVKESLEKSA